MRYFVEFSYNGAPYFGFQIQPNQISVQEVVEKAFSTLLREPIKIVGAGRTDTGVHAKKIYAHFDTEQTLPDDLVKRLNSFLIESVSIKRIFAVDDEAHARFSATYRTYHYYISTEKDPFTTTTAWQYWRKKLDINAMNEACKILFQYEDFTSFAKLHADNKTNLCKIYIAKWEEIDGGLKFTISANRFLRNMVRAIVGTMVEIGDGRLKPEDMHRVIKDQHRNSAGTSAPAHALYLADVGYDFID